MSSFLGISSNYKLITAGDIYAVNLTNCTLVTEGTGDIGTYGGYQVRCYHTASGCGGAESSIFLELKDNINWTWISCEFELGGVAACWGFNESSGFGGAPKTGYIQTYNTSLGDIIPNERALNSWEKSQFQTHNKTYACDNNTDNFFHSAYQTGDPKKFLMKRRRDTSGNRAGIHHGRSCNSTGTGAYTIIKNIYIWY